jgi:RNA polymerase sigma-70 factor, ECF subfamily
MKDGRMTLSDDASTAGLFEQELVKQAQAGDRRAFGDLVRLHRSGVVNVVYRMCGDTALAEDAAQECFIRAWAHLHQFRPSSVSERGFRNWLYRIAMNCALTMLRHDTARPTVAVDVTELVVADPRQGPEGRAQENERAAAVQRAVLALPEAGRIVLILREYEGLSYKEIAEAVGIPIGTVMSRLSYARSWLRERLTTYMEETYDGE